MLLLVVEESSNDGASLADLRSDGWSIAREIDLRGDVRVKANLLAPVRHSEPVPTAVVTTGRLISAPATVVSVQLVLADEGMISAVMTFLQPLSSFRYSRIRSDP